MVSELGTADCCGGGGGAGSDAGRGCCGQPAPAALTAAGISIADIEAVEEAVGMGHHAWDTVDPRELVAAILNRIAARVLGDTAAEEGDEEGDEEPQKIQADMPTDLLSLVRDDRYWVFCVDDSKEGTTAIRILSKCLQAAVSGDDVCLAGKYPLRYIGVHHSLFSPEQVREAMSLAAAYDAPPPTSRFQVIASSPEHADAIGDLIERLYGETGEEGPGLPRENSNG